MSVVIIGKAQLRMIVSYFTIFRTDSQVLYSFVSAVVPSF